MRGKDQLPQAGSWWSCKAPIVAPRHRRAFPELARLARFGHGSRELYVLVRPFLVALALVCAGCASKAPVGDIDASTSAPTGYVMVRSYVDRFSFPSGDELRRIEYGWDYDRGEAEQRIYTVDGELLETIPQPGLTLEPTDAELERALALVRSHPQLDAIAAAPDIELHGGFSLREPGTPCDRGSRCVHVMGAGPEGGARLHAIVDLAKDRVIDPDYQGPSSPFKKGEE